MRQKFNCTALHYATVGKHDEAITVLVREGGAQLRRETIVIAPPPSAFRRYTETPSMQFDDRPIHFAQPGTSTRALLEEMEFTGADELVLTKSAGWRKPAPPKESEETGGNKLTEASSSNELLAVRVCLCIVCCLLRLALHCAMTVSVFLAPWLAQIWPLDDFSCPGT